MLKSLSAHVSTHPVLSALFVLTLSLAGCNAKSTVLTFVNGTASPVDFTATNAAFGTITHLGIQPGSSATDIPGCRRSGNPDPLTVTASGIDCNGAWSVSTNPFAVSFGIQYVSTITSQDNGTNITYTLTVTAYNPKTGVTSPVTTATTTTASCTTNGA